jgi:hypothetical protein
MADLNIENFYRDIAVILTTLYACFPVRTAVYVEDVAGPDQLDEYGMHSPRHMAGLHALLWLEEEGFLRYETTIRQDGIDQAALTHKGFMRLSKTAETIYRDPLVPLNASTGEDSGSLPPSVIEDRMVIVNQLRSALRSGSSIALNKVVQYILQ